MSDISHHHHEHCHHAGAHDSGHRKEPHVQHRRSPGAEPARAESKAAPGHAQWTCPMHPEILRDAPGSCPICGMALEPVMPSAEAGTSAELADMTRRFWIGTLLSLPVVALEMGGHVTGLHQWLGQQSANWLQFLFATPVVLWAGWPFFVRAAQSITSRNLNMFTLIAMGTGVAWLYSVIATGLPHVFPPSFRGADGAVAVYFEAAAVITVLVLLGQVLELRARETTSGAIKALLDLAPKTARRIRPDDTDEEVPLESILVNDRLRVRPGEKVPVDGVVIEGRCAIDESMVTGESMPVTKAPGSKVIAGTMNQTGSFVMRADKVGHDTMLSRIVQMVAEAQRSRAPIQRMAASIERASEHPLAAAIVAEASTRRIGLANPTNFDSPVGKGVEGDVDGMRVAIGNAGYLKGLGIDTASAEGDAERLRNEGATAVFVAMANKLAGVIAIADPIKPTTPEALRALRQQGVKVVMLTGDNRTTAQAIARRLEISDVEAEVLPDQKSAVVARLRAVGHVVAMAGDGVNDAPALAAADVGIAMGSGTDVAMESAGVTLLKGDLTGIVRARTLSRATMANIRQNLFFAFVYNAAGVPIAAGILYPALGILLSPIIAAAAMALSSVSVIANALRLRR